MDLFARAQSSFLSWKHETPLPQAVHASPEFQSWHTFDTLSAQWIPMPTYSKSDIQTDGPGSGFRSDGEGDISNLVLLTWNMDATSPRTEDRVSDILTCITGQDPPVDIIFLQEVSRPALLQILNDGRIRQSWVSSERDDTAWGKQSFATMTLLSKKRFTSTTTPGVRPNTSIGPIWCVKFPSHFARDALCCDIFVPSPKTAASTAFSKSPSRTRIRLVNVHLDSLPIRPSHRPQQISIMSSFLYTAGRGLVAGDFNPVLDEDIGLLESHGLIDAWTSLHPEDPGYTWGTDGDQPFPANRLDKVGLLGLCADRIVTLAPNRLDRESGDLPLLSDHHALICSFGLADQ